MEHTQNCALTKKKGYNYKLLFARKQKNCTIMDLAQECKISRYQYSRIESGKTIPRIDVARRIATSLDLRLDDLL